MNNNNDSGNTSAVEINTARLVESAVAKTVESSVESNDKAVETTDKTAKMAKKPIIYGSQEECAEREGVGTGDLNRDLPNAQRLYFDPDYILIDIPIRTIRSHF